MSYESMMELTSMPINQTPEQILNPREVFFESASLDKHQIFCGDERPPLYDDMFIHVFGGVLNPVYKYMILREMAEPGSVQTSFADEAAAMTPIIRDVAEVNPGVHSDTHAEDDNEFHADKTDGPVGCGFAGKRQAISRHIADNRESILRRLQELYPELMGDETGIAIASAVIDAHDRLAGREQVFASGGRSVVLAAANAGASTMLVDGEHIGREGIINEVEDSSMDSRTAAEAGLPAYTHDKWATKEIDSRLQGQYPFDPREEEIADIIDTIGTMNALNVPLENIVRRRA